MPNVLNMFGSLFAFLVGVVMTIVSYFIYDGMIEPMDSGVLKVVLTVGIIFFCMMMLFYVPSAIATSEDKKTLTD